MIKVLYIRRYILRIGVFYINCFFPYIVYVISKLSISNLEMNEKNNGVISCI